MAQLEYRLFDEQKDFPALYHYNSITKDELVIRFLCDYLVKDGIVYEKTSNALEAPLHVIYVKLAKDEKPLLSNHRHTVRTGYIVLEIREFKEDVNIYPIIDSVEFNTLTDLAIVAQCNYFMIDGQEWEKTSFEVDEDRERYVLYAIRA